MTSVTNNVKDFAKYPGVSIENWLEPANKIATDSPPDH